jgi:two-component system sensor histidine kinase CpxA
MRFPLALKVSLWLLLNLLMLAALGGVWMLRTGGAGLSWDALVAGPSGNGAQALAESTYGELRNLTRRQWNDTLDRVSDTHSVKLAVLGEQGRILAGNLDIPLPDALTERLKIYRRPPPAPLPALGVDEPGDLRSGPPRPKRPPAQPPPPRLLVHSGEPASYWITVPLAAPPNRPREIFLIVVPDFWSLIVFLDLDLLLGIAAAAVVCSVLLWLPFVSAHARALRRLAHATEAIAGGRFDTRVPEKGRDELAALGASINHMSDRLDRLVSGQKRFLGDIAHELGSPIGRMQMGVGILEARAPADLQPSITDVRDEVTQMADLVAELLAFTRAGLLPRDAARARVELAPLAARVLAREAATDAVTLDLPAELAVQGDPALLARALGNLIRNALRYAGRATPITVTARAHGAQIDLTVADEGPGVPPDALARLGEPFFRPETARQRETGGAGLGLAIVRACTEACGGTVHFANRTPQGLSATLRLPAATP